MPELPEVETVRRGVHQVAVGRTIGTVNATGARTVRRSTASAVEQGLSGRTVVGTGRHGKWFWLDLDDEARVLIHLRMSGQLLWVPTPADRPKHTHVAMPFVDGGELLFVDPRTFGEVVVIPPFIDHMAIINQGPDALSVNAATVLGLLKGRHRQLKAMLLDQKVIAGIGNIYADEICHRSGIRPLRRADTLTKPAVGRLHEAIQSVLGSAIEARGSSLADEQYVDLFGAAGSYQHNHQVHARGGKPCLTCGNPIVRVAWSGRSTYFCKTCQR
jgi:formamidopyrimidine-DNA glycosylase